MVRLYDELRDKALNELTAAYNKLDAEAKDVFHKAVGVYDTHPTGAFFTGAFMVGILWLWVG